MRQRLGFQPSEDGDALLVDMWIEPGGGVPPHVHPSMEERFEVVSGRIDFLAGRSWQTAGPGESVTVPPGVRHAYRNSGGEPAHGRCRATPPQSLQEFLEDAATLARAGRINRHGLPTSPAGAWQALRLALRHRRMVVMRPI